MSARTQSAPEVRPSWISRLALRLIPGWHERRERRLERATLAMLQSLDARTLDDIGVSRSNINSGMFTSRHHRW